MRTLIESSRRRFRHRRKYVVGLFRCVLPVLWMLPLPALAQETPADTGAPQAGSETGHSADLPTLLFVLQRASDAPARKNDPNTVLLTTLRDVLRSSGKFQVLTYSPTQPLIKRAVLDHAVAAADLIEPIKQATLERLARAIGARYILTFSATVDRTSMQTDSRFEQSAGQQEWRTLFAEKIPIEMTVGRRRLNTNELVSLTVDAIADRIGVPSHLTQDLKLPGGTRVFRADGDKEAHPDRSVKETKGAGKQETPPAPTEISPPKEGRKVSKRSTPPQTAKGSGAGGAPQQAPPPEGNGVTQGGKLERAQPPTPSAPAGGKTGVPDQVPNAPKTRPERMSQGRKATDRKQQESQQQNSLFTTDASPGRSAAPPPVETQVPNAARPDYESQASKFRQTGDLANAITSLRRAINDRPHDLALRRQLIQAYQDAHLTGAAMAETTRALQMAPNDGNLYVLYGDTLRDKGDIPGATKAYREAARVDPGNVAAQVALGDLLLADSQFGDAIAAYQAAIKNDAKSPLPHRRLARAFCARAAADPTQYAASLDQIQQARALTMPTDTESYLSDYTVLMKLMESRLRDLLDELTNAANAASSGKRSANDSQRVANDMKDRAEAAADYLDKLPPAAGHDVTHAHYQQGAALLLQALSLFRDELKLTSPDSQLEGKRKSVQMDALREIDAAGKRLNAVRTAPDSDKPSDTNGGEPPSGSPPGA